MSPTVFKVGPYRFYFFSREEPRVHVHVHAPDGEAKFWLTPHVELATAHGLSDKEVRRLEEIVEERQDEIRAAWDEHFNG